MNGSRMVNPPSWAATMADISRPVDTSDRPARPTFAVRAGFDANVMRTTLLWTALAALLALTFFAIPGARAETSVRPGLLPTAPRRDIMEQIDQTFDAASQRVGLAVERSLSLFGEPNAYIIGGELSGSFVVGGRHGIGQLRFANGIPSPVTWSAFSIGVGLGASYDRVIMLVYGLDRPEHIFGAYASVGGSAHFLVGANATIVASDRARIVLISSGLGLRLSGDLSRLSIEPDTDGDQHRPPGDICGNPADCTRPGRR